jgi:YggT family protein
VLCARFKRGVPPGILYYTPPPPEPVSADNMADLMNALFWLIDQVIGLYITLVIIQVVLSWLVAFNVINTGNRFVYLVGEFLYRVTEPALKPIRRLLPAMGGIDLSPVVLILGLYFLRILVQRDIMPMFL